MQSSDDFSRESADAGLRSFRGPSFETQLARLVRMRSSGVARLYPWDAPAVARSRRGTR
jgi:hypothetical protein